MALGTGRTFVGAIVVLGTLACGGSDGTYTDVTVGEDAVETVSNQAPIIASFGPDSDIGFAGGTVVWTVVASDADGDALTYAFSVVPDTLALMVDGASVSVTLPADADAVTVTVTVSDGTDSVDSDPALVQVRSWKIEAAPSALHPDTYYNAVAFLNEDEGFVVGGSETGDGNVPYVLHFKDGTWTDETEGTSGHLLAVAPLSPTDVWAAGGGGIARHFDGTSWTSLTVPGGCTHSIFFVASDIGWMGPAEAGQSGMRHYTGGDLDDWQTVSLPGHKGINDLEFLTADDGWAVGLAGLAFHWDGTAWTAVPTPTTKSLTGITMVSPTLGYAVGTSGTILKWDGTAFAAMTSGLTSKLSAVAMHSDTEGFIVGANGVIMRLVDGEWVQMPSPTTANLMNLTILPNGKAWAVGSTGVVLSLP